VKQIRIKTNKMTVQDFVLNQKDQSINEWISLIEKAEMQYHETLILHVADHFNKIIVNNSAELATTN
jgi:hypothetical protein